jgi:two-component system response regulator MtrA
VEAGADDYVTKPFRPRELVARPLANLRADSGTEAPCVELNGLEINLATHTVRRAGGLLRDDHARIRAGDSSMNTPVSP